MSKNMGLHSKTATIEFRASNGDLEIRDVVYIDGVVPYFKKIFQGRGYKRPGVTIELDSGQGQFLVVGSGFDRDKIGDISGNDCDYKARMYHKCDLKFYEKRDLTRHIEAVHLGLRTICPEAGCNKPVVEFVQYLKISHSS